MTQQSRELFVLRGKNELDMYNVNKVLWTVFDKVSIEHLSPGLEYIMMQSLHQRSSGGHEKGVLCSSLAPTANEPHCQLIKLLF